MFFILTGKSHLLIFLQFRIQMNRLEQKSDRGFSIIELLIVLTIIVIMSTTTYFYLSAHQRLYKSDDQALLIADIFQEARQRSLTQRETLRVEIDLTANIVRLIDENKPGDVADDVLIRQLALLPPNEVKINQRPNEIDNNPPEPYETPSAIFKQSNYPMSLNNQVCTLRFQSNGTVVDAGTNTTGANASQIGMTLHIWLPDKNNPAQSNIARALTVIGSTGTVRLWEYDRNSTAVNKWKNTRRSGNYGG